MAKSKKAHVVPQNGGWAVRGIEDQRATSVFHTQSEAIKVAKQIARNLGTEVVVHNASGQISEVRKGGVGVNILAPGATAPRGPLSQFIRTSKPVD